MCLTDMLNTLSIILNLTGTLGGEKIRIFTQNLVSSFIMMSSKMLIEEQNGSLRIANVIQPTRYDPLFRRNNNLNLNPNDHHRSTQFGYYNQQIDDPRRWGRKKPPKHKYRHWDEYFQRNMYGRDNNFQSVTGLDEMRLMHEKHFKDKNNDMNRYINEQPYINYKKNGKVQREDYWQLYH